MAGRAVVVGAGISGVLVARALQDDGWSVTLAEGAHVGAGSSSRTAAGIRQQFSTPETVLAMRYAVRWFRDFAAEAGEEAIIQNGYLFLIEDPAELAAARRRVAMQQATGLTEVVLLEGAAVTERFPWVDPGKVVGATFCPTDGFLKPQVVYAEGARIAKDRGVEIVQGARVLGGRHVNGRLVAVNTSKGDLDADLVVDCTNAWTNRVGPSLGGVSLPVDPLKRYLWFLARGQAMSAETFAAMPLTILPTGTYCRPENDGALMFGRKHDVAPMPAFTYEDQDTIEGDYHHKAGVEAIPFGLWAELAEYIPDFAGFDGLTATTGGFYATTPDHNPFLDFDPAVPNLMRLVGFSGHGAMFGPVTAAVAVGLARAGRSLPELALPGVGLMDLRPFQMGRSFDHHESMVI